MGHLAAVLSLSNLRNLASAAAIAASVDSIDGKTPALGQALAAASVPVVLTDAQVTTLTPPAAITGFATAANQTTAIGHLDGVEGPSEDRERIVKALGTFARTVRFRCHRRHAGEGL